MFPCLRSVGREALKAAESACILANSGTNVIHNKAEASHDSSVSGGKSDWCGVVVDECNGRAADDYKLGPDSMEQPGVPKGTVTQGKWESKTVFPGTVRDYWVYVPAQYDGKSAACVMVFQDGKSYVDPKGQFRVPIVFDNLIHKKEMPVTIGIFINPGTFPATNRTPCRGATAVSSTTR